MKREKKNNLPFQKTGLNLQSNRVGKKILYFEINHCTMKRILHLFLKKFTKVLVTNKLELPIFLPCRKEIKRYQVEITLNDDKVLKKKCHQQNRFCNLKFPPVPFNTT